MPTPAMPSRDQIERADPLAFDGITRGDDPILAENATARRARLAAARDAAQAPAPAPKPVIVLSTTIAYRGRIITISNEGMTLDAFCDMLDKRFGAAQ